MMIDDSRTIALLQQLALLRAEQMVQMQPPEWRQWLQRRVKEVIEELKEED